MLVVNRFRVAEPESERLRADLARVREILAAQPGFLGGEIGRNVDDPELWVLTTRWADVGSYRRGLSSSEAKQHAWPVLYRALDEPSAYEDAGPGADLNVPAARSLG